VTELARRSEPAAGIEEQDLHLAVSSVEQVCDGVVALTLRHPEGTALPTWTPGAHVDVDLGPGLVRQYSLCGAVARADEWRLAVLRDENGRGGSKQVHRLSEGEVIHVRGPRNRFEIEDAPAYVFVAGGIGITPILPMINAANSAGAQWELLYGGRCADSMAFRDELAAYGDRVTLQPQDELGLLDVAALLAEPRPDTLVYCCGPEPLLAAVEAACGAWPDGSLHIERFTAAANPAASADDRTIEVELRASGFTVVVPPNVSILHAIEAAGLPTESSCRDGFCGTCETAVLEGEPDHRDSVLSESERTSGEVMMICCSRSKSPRLVLDL
jgi:ferredoxin-NADP reductase